MHFMYIRKKPISIEYIYLSYSPSLWRERNITNNHFYFDTYNKTYLIRIFLGAFDPHSCTPREVGKAFARENDILYFIRGNIFFSRNAPLSPIVDLSE